MVSNYGTKIDPKQRSFLSAAIYNHNFCNGYLLKPLQRIPGTRNFALGWLSTTNSFVIGRVMRIEEDTVHFKHFVALKGPRNYTAFMKCNKCNLHQEMAARRNNKSSNCISTIPLEMCSSITLNTTHQYVT